uniref:Uncharacterized protein n=1 Tax=Arundo donax TaxID=35708 RepID=A0A0A9GTA2_ARUDO
MITIWHGLLHSSSLVARWYQLSMCKK